MTLKDYDRAKVIEKGGIIDEADEDVKFAAGIKNYHEGKWGATLSIKFLTY